MRLANFALIWLAVVTALQAQGPEPSRAGARGRDDQTATGGEALAGWREGVKVAPVPGDSECHTIHTYFNTSPESPDGRRIYFNVSSDRWTRLYVAESSR